jgi:hypothetical protein
VRIIFALPLKRSCGRSDLGPLYEISHLCPQVLVLPTAVGAVPGVRLGSGSIRSTWSSQYVPGWSAAWRGRVPGPAGCSLGIPVHQRLHNRCHVGCFVQFFCGLGRGFGGKSFLCGGYSWKF